MKIKRKTLLSSIALVWCIPAVYAACLQSVNPQFCTTTGDCTPANCGIQNPTRLAYLRWGSTETANSGWNVTHSSCGAIYECLSPGGGGSTTELTCSLPPGEGASGVGLAGSCP